jgi:hypothetical protein
MFYFYFYFKFFILPKRRRQVKKLKNNINKLDETIFDAQLSLMILQSKPSYSANDIKHELQLIKIIEKSEEMKEFCNKILNCFVTSL